MISEEGAELVRPAREREKDIGNEARFFLDRLDPLADVVWQIGEIGDRESADRRRAHGARPSLFAHANIASPAPRMARSRVGLDRFGLGPIRLAPSLGVPDSARAPIRDAPRAKKKRDNSLTGRVALCYCFSEFDGK